jgi:hypothetical protein
VHAHERLRRAHVDARHEREVEHEKAERVPRPCGGRDERANRILDVRDRAEEEEAWKKGSAVVGDTGS